MALVDVLTNVVVVVLGLLVVFIPGIAGLDRLRRWRESLRRNLESSKVELVGLGIVLAVNRIVRDVGVDLSWLIGVEVTALIHELEKGVVADIQGVGTPALTAYFGFMYVYGYTFVLVFPFVAYLLEDDSRPLRVLMNAYAFNYVIGLVCYVAFIAYGPRNYMPELVDSLLYVHWPDVQLLTSRVNSNTNVFPSLHASLATTVAILAYRYRSSYPRWFPIASVFAVSIVVATMYLGIHWFTDVVFGVVLAVTSIKLADRYVGDDEPERTETQGLPQVFADD